MPQLTPKELDQIRNSMAAAEDSVVVAMIKAVLSGGIDKVHPEILRICIDEINARGISADLLGENKMRTTIPRLRKTIRKMIVEAKPHRNPRHHLQTHPGIGLAHADTTGVNCDFNSSAHQLLSKQVWQKLGGLQREGDWSMPDGGDGYRFINSILQCRCPDTGKIMMAVYCVDRANSYNATETSYDVYVLDCELINEKHLNYGSKAPSDRDLSSDSRRWAKDGEYCTNTDQIVATLKEAHKTWLEFLEEYG